MSTTQANCSALHHASKKFADLLAGAITVVPDLPVAPPTGSAAHRILRFEVVHNGAGCPIAMADACLVIVANDLAVRFVAPTSSERANYVSYWEVDPARTPLLRWQPLADGVATSTPHVCIASQTLTGEFGVGAGAGYLHYTPGRLGDGWTVAVGVRHDIDPHQLADLALTITVSARPDWSPTTGDLSVLIP